MICSAWREGPNGETRCGAPAPFGLNRVVDTGQYVCPEHLGPVLMHGVNLPWPPEIEWEGAGERPPNSLSPEQRDAREDAHWRDIQESMNYPDMGPPSK